MIEQAEYQARRNAVMAAMGQNTVALVASNKEITRSNDTCFPFRQDNQFYYLTGFNEPDAVLVLMPGDARGDYHLFLRDSDALREQWDGLRCGVLGAKAKLLASSAYAIETLAAKLPELLADKSALYYCHGRSDWFDQTVRAALLAVRKQARMGVSAPETIHQLDLMLDEMRLIKSDAELAVMRHVAAISAKAHVSAMKNVKHYQYEYQLAADILHTFHQHGCRGEAYSSIVGSGDNACILHYIENSAPLKAGSLVLIDAGGEYQNYAADITRCFPVSGQFSAPQRAIYQLVLDAQLAGIACIKPGLCWTAIQQVMVEIITAGLVRLGLLTGEVEALIEQRAYLPFYMHNSGHWLGLDVHDAGAYKVAGQWRTLEPGMVLTVEPGIYISQAQDVPDEYKGIGVRIEDDVLVTATGVEVLTAGVPKHIDEIEALMATSND